jgi:hypothetical protein
MAKFAEEIDEMLVDTVCELMQLEEVTPTQRELLLLPISEGGWGLPSLNATKECAFIGGTAATPYIPNWDIPGIYSQEFIDKRTNQVTRAIARVKNDILQKSLITAEQRTQAIETARAKGVRAERAIVELGLASEEDVLDAMSQVLGIDRVDVAHAQVDRAVLALLPSKVVFRKRVVPVARENGTLTVATSDPLDLYGLDEVAVAQCAGGIGGVGAIQERGPDGQEHDHQQHVQASVAPALLHRAASRMSKW